MFQDKLTYISAIMIGLCAVAKALGYIDEATYQILIGLFGAGAVAALRNGLGKVQEKVTDQAVVVAKTLAVEEKAQDKKVLDAIKDAK